MLSQKQLFQTNEYWLEIIQNEIFRELSAYMKSKNLNQTQLAKDCEVSKGYISQITNDRLNISSDIAYFGKLRRFYLYKRCFG